MRFDKYTSVDQLLDFCAKFDVENSTQTHFTELTLKEIRNITNNGYYEYDYLRKLLGQTFNLDKKIYSNDARLNRSYIGKLNSFYLMTKDLRAGKKFYSPMSLSIMPDKVNILHPGKTRLLYSEVYNDPVQIMITDYCNDHLKFDTCEFAWDSNIQVLYSSHGQDHSDPYVSAHFRKYNLPFKTITDQRLDKNDASYHDPTQVDPPRCFELIRDSVYINGDLILKQIGKNWTLVL